MKYKTFMFDRVVTTQVYYHSVFVLFIPPRASARGFN